MAASAERDLERSYPWIPWREPVKVTGAHVAGERWGCRFCIAMYGLHGRDVGELWESPQGVQQHLAQFHPE